MTKEERKLVNASFKAVKELITKCDLDPYYKGELLRLINKVIRNKNSHFRNRTTDFASLFSWYNNDFLRPSKPSEWSTIGLYLNKGVYKEYVISIIDKIHSK